MDLHLLVIAGPDKGKTFPLHTGPDLMLGKCHNAYYQLHDPSVARNHCQILRQDDKVTVVDNATGSLFVNGLKTTQRILVEGDVLRLGDTQLRYFLSEPEPEVPDEVEVVDDAADEVEVVDDWDALVGTKLGHFELGPILGTGRAAGVFKAKDHKSGQTVSLKVLSEGIGKRDDAVKAFVKTIKIVLPLRHPHLLTVLGAGKTGHHCWVASEYVDGLSMAQAIEQVRSAGTADWHDAFNAAMQIARALETAHKAGLAHGHLTPTNVLRCGRNKVTKVADLMLSRAMQETEEVVEDGDAEPDPVLGYLSPERTRGWKEVDTRSDLYSLGALVYGLLAGRPPFVGKTVEMLTARVRDQNPEKPTKYQRTTPLWFEKIVLRLLAKKPKDRYSSPGELLMELEDAARMAGMTG